MILELVMENCEQITVSENQFCALSNCSHSYLYEDNERKLEYIKAEFVHIIFDVTKAKAEWIINGAPASENIEYIKEVLNRNNITQIHIDGKEFLPVWSDDEFTNKYQKTKIEGNKVDILIEKGDLNGDLPM